MSTNFETTSETHLDPNYYEKLYKEVDAKLFEFKNEIQLKVFQNISNNVEIQKLTTTSSFNILIAEIAVEQSPILRGKIYEFLLSEVAKSEDPAELLKFNKDNINEIIDDDKKEELVNNLTDYIESTIISKNEKSIAA